MSVRSYGHAGLSGPCLIWTHGGSWIRGSVEQWHSSFSTLAQLLEGTLISVRYSLAPQFTHPTQTSELLTAVNVIRELNAPEVPVVVGGDSAGGTIAASASLCRPDLIDAAVLAYPPLDPECSKPSYQQSGRFPHRADLVAAWEAYRGTERAPQIPISPILLPDLSASPPVSLIVGESDPVRDDVRRYSSNLKEAGVTVRLAELGNVHHGDFLQSTPILRSPVLDWVAAETNHYFSKGTQDDSLNT